MQKVNKTNIAAILRESVFSPRDDLFMNIISDVGNTDYYITRAIEELRTSRYTVGSEEISKKVKRAISLLALARLSLE